MPRALAMVSTAQLGAGLAGMALALRRRRAYDLGFVAGRPDRVARDSFVMGTALSAPVAMLVTQGVATVRLARSDDPRAARVLRVVGGAMVAGYLGERLVRRRLSPSGWDTLESPTVLAGLTLAAAMAAIRSDSI